MKGFTSRRGVIYLALSVMTASWIAGLTWALVGDAGPPLPVNLGTLTLLTLVPLGLSRWLRGLELREDLRRGILAGAFIFVLLLAWSSGFFNQYGLFGGAWMDRLVQDDLSSETFLNQFTSLALVASCWWLGLKLGDTRLTSTNLLRYFYICIAALVWVSLPTTFFVAEVYRDAPWLYFVLLFAGLVSLGLGRVEEAARRSQDPGARFTTYWLAQIGLAAGGLLALLGLAQVLKLAHGLGLILVLVAPVVAVLILPIVYVGARLLVLSGLRVTADGAAGAGGQGGVGDQVAQAAEPSTVQSLIAGLVVLLMILAIILPFVFARRRWRELARTQEDEKEALPSLGERVTEAVEERLGRWGLRLPGIGRLRRRWAARSIRRIYADLTALGAERGHPRMPARTPYEHLGTLRQAFPGCEAQVERITEAYVAVHYGEVPETREALQEIRAAWAHVREVARHAGPFASTEAAREGRRG